MRSNVKDLTDEQIKSITELSKNDEDAVVGSRVSDIYNRLDASILEGTGVVRGSNEKTYDYLKRSLSEMKQKGDGYEEKISALEKERDALKAGGSEALKAVNDELEKVRGEYSSLKSEYDKQEGEFNAKLFSYRLDGDLKTAAQGLKFKQEIPDAARSVLLSQALDKVKGLRPEYKEDGTLVFKDDKGVVMLNKDNALKPYTASELVKKELMGMGVLSTGRKQGGTGGEGGGNGAIGELSGAKSQVEFDDMARTYLLKKGLIEASAAYQEEWAKLREEYKVKDLPLN